MTSTNLNSAIDRLKGRILSSVEFVQDYVQFRFDGPCLTAYTHPTINLEAQLYTWDTPGYFDKLHKMVGSTVIIAEADDYTVSVKFESGNIISISLRDEDYVGPEAIQFVDLDDGIWVG